MNTTVNHPTLQGAPPPASRGRSVLFILGLLVILVIAVVVYRASFAVYEERRSLDYLKHGTAYFAQGYFEDAKFELEISSRLGRSKRNTYVLLAKSQAALGEMEQAAVNFRRAVELGPEDAENRFSLATALVALGRRHEAVEQLEEALDEKPSYTAARFLLAKLLTRENRYKEASDHFQVLAGQSISKTQLGEVHVALAKLLIKQGHKPRAQHLLQTAWLMDRKNDEAWRLIMELGRGKGHEDDVIGTIESTDAVRSKITSPAPGDRLNDEVVEVRGVSSARFGAVVQVEVTNDGGHSWRPATPVNGVYDQWIVKVKFPDSDGRRFILYSRATGSGGLPESPSYGVAINVDNAGPAVIRQTEPSKPTGKNGWYVTPPRINLATLEGSALIFYKWNNDEYRTYISSFHAPVGVNRLRYFTRDRHGNESPVETVTLKAKVAETK